jgi:hypothetical protein
MRPGFDEHQNSYWRLSALSKMYWLDPLTDPDGNAGVLYLVCQCKAKDDDLNHRHAKQNEHRSLVTKYVVKFFFYKREKLFTPKPP